ncbi:gliding motility-associated C-terminal domain-containing protein [Patiriisocius sp. Uisw_047]|uniref:T9SS type B sorting domain-containing protein n=1 Tax=Patiriisocius sp. Uisw_047 TaxID=3230969 RepID=UPI0039E8FB23
MKRALLIVGLLFAGLFAGAQSYNPYVNQGIVSPAPMLPTEFNGTGLVSFNLGNTGSTKLDLVTGQEMALIVTLSKGVPDNLDPLAAMGGTWLFYFDWTYDATITSYRGVQNQDIPGNASGDITITYKVTDNTSLSTASNGFNANLQPPPYTNGFNDASDDAVSSFTYVLATDFGDAPISYGAASHEVNIYRTGGDYTKYIYLGSSVDPETANQPSAAADSDDINDTDGDVTASEDDEDGVVFPVLVLGTTVDIPVELTINNDNGSNNGFLNAWIDWNGDGDFDDAAEQIITNQFFFASGATNYSVAIPSDAISTQPTFARFRVGDFSAGSDGLDNFGEVEDYQVTIQSASAGIISGIVEDDNGNPIPGVTLNLDDGNPVTPVLTTTTAFDGSYSFIVSPGDYTIEEVQPTDYTNVSDGDAINDGIEDLETNDGSTTNDTIPVSLVSGETDSGNNFIENCLAPDAPLVTVTPADCTSAAVVTVTNYDAGLTYTSTAAGLMVGAGGIVTGGVDGDMYTITATSAATCVATSAAFTNDTDVQLAAPDAPLVTVTPADCTSAAVVTVSNYDAALTYTSTAAGLVVGAGGIVTGGVDGDMYTITATSAATCVATSAAFTNNTDAQLAAPDAPLVTVTPADCTSAAVVTVSNYDAALTYTSTAPGLMVGVGGIVTGGVDGDMYTITATSAATCVATSAAFTNDTDVQLAAPDAPLVTVTPADCTSAAVVTVSNYDAALTYTSTAAGLVVGAGGIVTGGVDGDMYTITATSAATCVATSAAFTNDTDAQLAAPDAPLVTVTPADCTSAAVVTVSNYDAALTYTSTAPGLIVGAGGIVTGGVDGDMYTITATSAATCVATSAAFTNNTDAQLAAPDAPLVTVTPADCTSAAVVTVSNYDAALTYTSTAPGLIVGVGGIVTGGVDGDMYTITATSAATCVATSAAFTNDTDVQLAAPDAPLVTVTPADCTSAAVVTVSNYDAGLTYTSTAPGLMVGAGGIVTGGVDGDMYTITATSAATCVATSAAFTNNTDVQLAAPDAPLVTVTPADCTSAAVVTVTNYDASLTYTSTAPGLIVGAGGIVTGGVDGDMYTITATSAATCVATSAAFTNDTDVQLAAPDAPLVTVTPADCTSAAVVTVSNYDAGLTYTSTAPGLMVGAGGIVTGGVDGDMYTITATSAATCVATSAAFTNNTDVQLAAPDAPLVAVTPADCTSAAAVVTVTNYDASLTYTSTAPGLIVGAGGIVTGGVDGDMYTITATSAATCVATSAAFTNNTDVQLAAPDAPLVTVTPADCTSAAVVTVTNYDASLTYTSTAPGLIVGAGGIVTGGVDGDMYTITATSAATCVATSAAFTNDTDVQLAAPDAPLVTVTPADCTSAAVVTVSNYDAGLTYTSTAPGLMVGAGGIVTGGVDGDMYTITATSAATCVATSAAFTNNTDVQLAAPDAPLVAVTPADCTSAAVVTVTNYDASLTYTSTAPGLIVGAGGIVTGGVDGDMYTITATSAATCVATSAAFTNNTDVQLAAPDAPLVTVTPADCTSAAVVTVTNYDAGLTYTSTAPGLMVGAGGIVTGGVDGDMYTITATSAATCVATSAAFTNNTDVQLAAPDAPLVTVTPADCTSAAVVTVTNYDASLTYTSTAPGLIVGAGGIVTGGVDGDMYTITATSAATCVATSAAFTNDTDVQLAAPDAPLVTVTPADCTSAAVVTVSNYDAGLTYTSTAPGLMVGAGGIVTGGVDGDMYTITATSAATCVATSAAFTNNTDVQLAAPDAPLVAVTPADCTSAAVVTVTNYDASLTYTSTAPGLIVGLGGVLTGGIDGQDYTITAENAATCTSTSASFTYDDDAPLDAPDAPVASVTASPTCADANAGEIVFTVQAGVEYSINAGATYQASATFSGLAAGSYNLFVRNTGNTCETAGTNNPIVLTPPTEPSITNVASTDPTDCSIADGTITISATGGTAPLEYSIDGSATWQASNTFSVLSGGTYQIRVRNSDGSCVITAPNVILTDKVAPSIMNVVSTDPTDCGEVDGTITISASGLGALEYSINGGTSWQASDLFIGLTAGTYQIRVRNIDGTCLVSVPNKIITAPTAPAITQVDASNPTDCGINDGTITVTATGTSIEYSIDGGTNWQVSNSFTGLSAGTYNVFVRNANGSCETASTDNPVNLTAPSAPSITNVASSDPTNCGLANGTIIISTTGGTAPLEYSINGSATWQANGGAFTGLTGGVYQIRVRNSDGSCVTTAPNVILTDKVAPSIMNVASADPTDCGEVDGTITISASGLGALQYSINGGTTWQSSDLFIGLTAGTYQIRVRNGGDGTCIISDADVILNAPQQPVINSVTSTNPTNCDIDNGTITITATGGTGTLEYSIDGGNNWSASGDFTTLAPGTYNVRVRYNNGTCEVINTSNPVILTAPTAPATPIITITPADCNTAAVVMVTNYDAGVTYTSSASGLSVDAAGLVTGGTDGQVYTITAENLDTCTATSALFTYEDDAPLTALAAPMITVTPADCDTDAVVTITNYDAALMYTSTAAGLMVGAGGVVTGGTDGQVYTITAENLDTCTATSASFTYDDDAQLAAPATPIITIIQANCISGTIVSISNYDINMIYTSTALGLMVGAGGAVTGGTDGQIYTITAENFVNCTATSALFTYVDDAPLAAPAALMITVTPADCASAAVVTVSNYDAALVYTSTASGLMVGAGGVVTGGIDGQDYTITAENADTCTSTSASFTYDDDAQLAAPATPMITITPADCASGTIVSITNYDAGVTYTSTASGLTVDGAGVVSGGTDGQVYTITAENLDTCTATSVLFTYEADAQLAAPATPMITITPADCDSAAVMTVSNYDTGLTYTSAAAGLTVDGAGVITGGVDGQDYTITAKNAATCIATSVLFTYDDDASLAAPATPMITITPADCTSGTIVLITNYDAGLTYTSTASGLTVDGTGVVSGGTDGQVYTITAENLDTCTATSALFTYDDDAQLAAPATPMVTVTPADCGNAAVMTVSNYDAGLTYTSAAAGLTVDGAGVITGGIDGQGYTITAENAATCSATSVLFTYDDDAQLAAPVTPMVTVIPADCNTAAVVAVSNYDAGLTYTSAASGLTVDGAGVVSGGTDGQVYTITAENLDTCTATSAFFTYEDDGIQPNADAGDNGLLEICSDSMPVDLFDSLGGTPDTGGIWTPTLTSGTGFFDPSLDAAVVYTYTVYGIPTCVDDSAEITVSITEAPGAGENGNLTICEISAAVDLTLSLGGTPEAGGTWTPTLVNGTDFFDPSIDAAGTYVYTVAGVGNCDDATSFVTVDVILQEDAGEAGLLEICSNSMAVNLFDSLGGAPDSGGIWTPTLTSGTGFFDPALDIAGLYTYTITGTAPCADDSADVTVVINEAPDAGENGNLTICEISAAVDLTLSLGGIPEAGGTWTPALAGGTDFFDPSIDSAGTYMYSVAGVGNCDDATSFVTVDIILQEDAGEAGLLEICSDSMAVNLFDSLVGTPDAGGAWTPILTSGTGFFDPALDAAGVYTYTISGTAPCADDSAEVTVTINQAPNDLVIESIDQELCTNEFISIEFEGPVGVNQVIEIYSNAGLTVAANPATAAGASWQSLDVFTASGSIWAVLSDINTGCNSNTLEIPFTVSDCADLAISKTVSTNTPDVGDTVDFVITVANLGASDATSVIVQEILPSGYDTTTATIATSAGTYDLVTGNWSIPMIISGTSETLTITVVVNPNGDYTNCASISSLNEIDPNLSNNIACATADPISQADLEIIKVVNNATPYVGDTVQFTIALANNGPSNASGVTVMELLPSGYTFISSNAGPDYNPITGIWTIESIVSGDTLYLDIAAMVNASGVYMNCAEVIASNKVDPDLTNNSDCAETSPIALIDLSVIKVVDNMTPEPEDAEITFTIKVTNDGPSDATGVEVIDILASGYDFVSSFAEVGAYNENSGVWTVANVPNSATYYLDITVSVLSRGEYLNTTEVISANEEDVDSTPDNGIITEDDYSQVVVIPNVAIKIPDVFTPNGDGVNDKFSIDNLEALYPNFSMEIFNRFGNVIYDYAHNGNSSSEPIWWKGFSDGRWNIAEEEMLPAGTYYYILYFNDEDRKPQTGWIYLSR